MFQSFGSLGHERAQTLPYTAKEVFVTGTFDDWGKTVKLDRVGNIFSKKVDLPEEKVQYKFVVDGTWTTDKSAREENDGKDNINNVLLPEEIIPHNHTFSTAAMSGVTPESTTAALAANVAKEPNGNLPGTFPETPLESEQILSVNPIPASTGPGNPIKLNPGEKVPDLSSIHGNTVESTVKLDKESYEKSDSLPLGSTSALTDTADSSAFVLPPISSSSPLIPESSIPMGGPAQQAAAGELESTLIGGPAQQAATADPGYTIQSAAPTSTTAALAAEVPLEKDIKANGTVPATEVPEVVKESLTEAGQAPEAAAYQEAVDDKNAMEKEIQEKVDLVESAGEPAPTVTAATTDTAPSATATTETAPAAATTETETAPSTAATTETAPAAATTETETETAPSTAATTETAPADATAETETALSTAVAAPSTGIESEDISPNATPLPQGVAAASASPSEPQATESTGPTVTNGVDSVPTAEVSTPVKPAVNLKPPTKEQKKKNRLSGFFEKLKEKLR
ncbi:hypothetical protein N7495_008153 [Penicillium taxi]|uniref:uncharacterized protein n=1 Tax=Penicillium taxi TaxID=168475 RepID=UPI0025457483|nr:uncharacterized protein N7495_008153 [Penicillium taxi]KAJ5888112.1 hypothetical protein N7495_008153 [Penicillium taxi]